MKEGKYIVGMTGRRENYYRLFWLNFLWSNLSWLLDFWKIVLLYFLSFPVCFWCESSAEKNPGHWGINCLYQQRRSPLQLGTNLIPRGGGDQGNYWAISEALQLGSEMATHKKEVCGFMFLWSIIMKCITLLTLFSDSFFSSTRTWFML